MLRKSIITGVVVGFYCTLFTVFTVKEAEAIPTFARKYRTSCSTCHVAMPKRNAFGDAFRRNGFRIPGGDSAFIKEEPVSLGAEAWKNVWPETIWPGELPGTIPVSFYGHQRFVWTEDAKPDTNFDAPHELELLIGGTFGDRISFFAEWLLFEKAYADDREKLGAMYLQFNDLNNLFFGNDKEGLINLKFGKFETGAARGFKDNNRLTSSHPITYDFTVAGGGTDVGLRTKQSGIELNGIVNSRLEYAAGIVNGNGSNSDNNSEKDWFYRGGYKFGGMGLDGTNGGREDTLSQKDNWRDDSVTVGTFGYFGQPDEPNFLDYQRYGIDLRLMYDRFDIGSAVALGIDEITEHVKYNTIASFVDAQYLFFPWLIGNLRYENLNYDNTGTVEDTELFSVNLTLLQRANIRWSIEGSFYTEDSDGADTIKGNVMFAF